MLSDWAFIPFNYVENNQLEHLKKVLKEYANYKCIKYEDLPKKISKKSIKEIKKIYLLCL